MSDTGKIVFLDPVSETGIPEKELAPRIADFRGKTAGFLFNGHHAGLAVFDLIKEKLAEKVPVSDVVGKVKPNLGTPLTPQAIDELASMCDFVVLGIGA